MLAHHHRLMEYKNPHYFFSIRFIFSDSYNGISNLSDIRTRLLRLLIRKRIRLNFHPDCASVYSGDNGLRVYLPVVSDYFEATSSRIAPDQGRGFISLRSVYRHCFIFIHLSLMRAWVSSSLDTALVSISPFFFSTIACMSFNPC